MQDYISVSKKYREYRGYIERLKAANAKLERDLSRSLEADRHLDQVIKDAITLHGWGEWGKYFEPKQAEKPAPNPPNEARKDEAQGSVDKTDPDAALKARMKALQILIDSDPDAESKSKPKIKIELTIY